MSNWQMRTLEPSHLNEAPGNWRDIISVISPLLKSVPEGDQKVLDVGCNTAWFAHFFTNYYGIDIDSRGVHFARSYWEKQGRWQGEELQNRIRTISASDEWPADLSAFEGIILRDVLEHVVEPIGFFKMAASRLKSGGWIFISAPDSQSWLWNDPTHRRPYPLKAQVWLAELVGAKVVYSGYESVAPGTQKIARIFNGRSPWIIRLLSRLRWWPRNAVTLLQVP